MVQSLGSLFGDVQHGGAVIDVGQPDAGGIERQLVAGTDGHFQGVTGGLRAVQAQPSLNRINGSLRWPRVPAAVPGHRCPDVAAGIPAARLVRACLAWSLSACLPLWRIRRSRDRLAGLLAGGVGVGE